MNAPIARSFSVRTELAGLQYTVHELDMRKTLLACFSTTTHFNRLRQIVSFAVGASVYMPAKICELVRAAASLQEAVNIGFGIEALMNTKNREVNS